MAQTEDGQLLRDLPPAALIVGIGKLDQAPSAAEGTFQPEWDLAQLRADLVAELNRNLAVTEVIEVDTEEAAAERCDVFIQPSLASNETAMAYREMSDDWWAAGGLWLITWVGGLFVNDATYDTEFAMSFDLKDIHAMKGGLNASVPTNSLSSDPVDLDFFDRNGFFSWPTLQSFILPPFWTSDSDAKTASALADRATRSVGTKLASFLKEDFESRADVRIELLEPKNFGVVETDTVKFSARSPGPITQGYAAILQADGTTSSEVIYDATQAELDKQTGIGQSYYEQEFSIQLTDLAIEEIPSEGALIRITAFSQDRDHVRSIRVFGSSADAAAYRRGLYPSDD